MNGPPDSGGVDDLVGDISGSDSQGANPQANDNNALQAVNGGIDKANQDGETVDEKQRQLEEKVVRLLFDEYSTAREFDKSQRQTYGQDRKYAAGMSDPSWASDANLVGSFIDILVAFLYAQNPDVNSKPAEIVGGQPDEDTFAFAETMEIIISKLWHVARLKKPVRRQVRSALTVGIGWVKALMWSKQRPQPQVEKAEHTAVAQLARIQALMTETKERGEDCADIQVEQERLSELLQGLQAKKMKTVDYGLNVDFVRAEDIQVSLDVSCIGDYTMADWMSEDLYIPKKDLRVRFPRLSDEDSRMAVTYYQKNQQFDGKGETLQQSTGAEPPEGSYSKNAPNTLSPNNKPCEFIKIIEFWDRRDGLIKTMVDGIKIWAVEPYAPPQATTNFYPYFGLEFFPVDGQRHPQSLCWRLRKLQDEYNACRSNQRLTRERSIPGLIFNGGIMSPEDARKLEQSTIAEMVAIQPTDITVPIQNIIMAKPLPTINVALWNTDAIRQDMEAISGVQEALQQSTSQQPKTATEAQIQQTGMASRTSADRDSLEDMLDDLAQYTGEAGIQEIDPNAAQRIAGPKAYWPFGMDVQDLLTMVDIDITAGTTGKPNLAADKANWATILPLLQKLMVQIRQLQSADPALANAMENLLRESLHRMDDRLDITQFIPTTPPPPPPPPSPPEPAISVSLKGELPPLDASMIGARAAGLPPAAALADGGANSTAIGHAAAQGGGLPPMPEGEMPPHPLMPEPLPKPSAAPHTSGAVK